MPAESRAESTAGRLSDPRNEFPTAVIVGRWIIGLLTGTLVIAATSPLFVRTYAGRTWDTMRQRWVYPEGLAYRWRSEGYATSVIGPHGIVGRAELPPFALDPLPGSRRVALWGDSQAEGVTVPDHSKIWAALERTCPSCQVIPLAGSGQDARDWTREIGLVETKLQVDEHWILLSELIDFDVLVIDSESSDDSTVSAARSNAWLDYVPDFVVQSVRTLVLNSDNQVRKLDFSIGIAGDGGSPQIAARFPLDLRDAYDESFWQQVAERLDASTRLPITVIYAPQLPVVIGDSVISDNWEVIDFGVLSTKLSERGIQVIDCRDAFRESAAMGAFPHGFHNGRFGSGHLNHVGNELIAKQVASDLQETLDQAEN